MSTNNVANIYSIENQVYSLAQLTSTAFGVESAQPNAFANLQDYVTNIITTTINTDQAAGGGNYLGSVDSGTTSTWSIVWGPVVFSKDTTSATVVADNIMALYYNQPENAYLVAIAGTNGVSTYDWFSEDFDATDVSQWTNLPNPKGGGSISKAPLFASISIGAFNGMTALLGMQAQYNNQGNAVNLVSALQTAMAANPAANLYVAGHSLGGGLTALMSLYLYENESYWRPSDLAVTINALPTAGPTFNNGYFATYFEGLLNNNASATNVGFTYTNLVNSIDVVPMGLDASTMMNVPFIYDSYYTAQGSPADAMVGGIVTAAICASYLHRSTIWPHLPVDNNYTQITGVSSFDAPYQPGDPYASTNPNPLGVNSTLSGVYDFFNNYMASLVFADEPLNSSQLNGGGSNGVNYTLYLVDMVNFLLQIAYQHTVAYYGSPTLTQPIEIYDFITEYHTVQSQNPPPTASVTYISQPEAMVKGLIKKHLGIKDISKVATAAKVARANMEMA